MADDKDEIGKDKEAGPSGVKFPMLTTSNYTVWSIRMTIALKVFEVWETIDPGTKDVKKNNRAIAYLFQSIPEALVLQIGIVKTTKDVWESMKARNLGDDRVREARLQTLMVEFDKLKMKDGDSIDSFVGKLSEITSKAAALGEIIDETKTVKKFLKSLPRKRYSKLLPQLNRCLT